MPKTIICKNQAELDGLLNTLNKLEFDSLKITPIEPLSGSKGNLQFLVVYWQLIA